MNRMLLSLLTLALSLAPVLCRAAEPKTEEAKAIAEIEKLGGTVTRDETSPGQPVIAVDFRYQPPPEGTIAGLTGRPAAANPAPLPVPDAALTILKRLPHLRSLDLGATTISDAGLEHLRGLTQLQSLNLHTTQVTDAGLVHLKALTKLQSLALPAALTDAGLEQLRGLTNLKSLDLRFCCAVTDAGLKHLEELPQLESLDLQSAKVADAGLAELDPKI